MTGRLIRLALQSHRRPIRDALRSYFDNLPEFDVVGQTDGLSDLPELCALRHPDVAVADVGRLTTGSVEQLRGLRAAAPGTEIVLSYGSASPPALDAAAAAGLTAIVPTSRGLDVLLRVIRRRATAAGRRPGVSARTVENYKRRLYAKLGVGNTGRVVSRAATPGLITPPSGDPRPAGVEQGRVPVVIAHGRPGPCLDAVALAVLGAGLPLVLSTPPAGGPAGPDDIDRNHWLSWHRGALAVVLVDPGPEDWAIPTGLPAPLIVVHSTGPDLSDVADAVTHGAQALVRGAEVRENIVALLSLARRGYLAMGSAHLNELADRLTEKVADRSGTVPVLSPRERDILRSIANGDTVRQTARALGIAEKTVASTQARLLLKLGARDRSEALAIGYRLGLVEPV